MDKWREAGSIVISECFNFVITECLSCNTCVILSKRGSIPLIIALSVLVSDVVEKTSDSSSKSNPLRRRRENYDAST